MPFSQNVRRDFFICSITNAPEKNQSSPRRLLFAVSICPLARRWGYLSVDILRSKMNLKLYFYKQKMRIYAKKVNRNGN